MYSIRSTITVAICTHDRPEQLERLLGSLSIQSRVPLEILIVDNAPSTERSAQLVLQRFPGFRYVREPIPGLDFARNRALRESTADVVAFIDDDAVATQDWVENIARVFDESPRIAACTGNVGALSLETEGARVFETYGGFGRGDQRIDLPPGTGMPPPRPPRPLVAWSFGVGSGVSMAVRRAVAIELDGFDEALDMGIVLPGGGDLDMLWRILEGGYRLVYEPRVRAWHEHRPTRQLVELQILEHNRAAIAMLTKFLRVARGSRKFPVLVYLLWRLVKPLFRLGMALIGRESLPFRFRMLISVWRGLVAYPAGRRLAAERRSRYGPPADDSVLAAPTRDQRAGSL